MSDRAVALIWIERIYLLGVFFQSVEFWLLRLECSESGVWRASTLGFFMRSSWTWEIFLWIRAAVTLVALVFPGNLACLIFLWLGTFVISRRWRGSFNGGSDAMCFLVGGILVLAALPISSDALKQGALWYLAIQVCLSYFVAGIAKLKNPAWRDGSALKKYLLNSSYVVPESVIRSFKSTTPPYQLLSILIMVFEIFFPLAMICASLSPWFLAAGLLFHLANFWHFGLNRFFWAWLAAYPALLFCSQTNGF